LELQISRLRLEEERLRKTLARADETTQYHADLFHSAPVGYLVLDDVGRILEANQSAASLLGRKREQLIHQTFTCFVAEEGLADFLSHLRHCKNAPKEVATELLVRADRRLLPVELVSRRALGRGRVKYHTAMIDISERQRAERQLQRTQQDYRDLINSIEGIVWEGGSQMGEFTFVSQQAERLLGYPVARWLREPKFFREHLYWEDRERVMNARRGTTGENFTQEFRMVTVDGRIPWLRNSVTATTDAFGKPTLRGVIMNITELKATEEALREETRMLEALNRIGASLAGVLDMEKLARVVAESGKEVTGAEFGAFSYRTGQGKGNVEKFELYATSEASRKIFERLPAPRGVTPASSSDSEQGIIRIDDLLRVGRYSRLAGPDAGTKSRLAVRSYLAVPVVSRSGEIVGGLLFGHPAPGAFTARAQELAAGIAAEAAIAMDNARLYRAVSQREAHFRQLADAMPQMVWTARPDGAGDYFNQRWYEYTGMAPDHPRENARELFTHEEDLERCQEAWRQAVESGQPFQTECRIRNSQGEHRWHLVRAVPVASDTGEITAWFGAGTDINDQKQTEEEMRQLNATLERRVSERTAQLESSNKELEAFSYSVSHDLRAPLRSIDAFSQLVREDYEDKLDDQGRQYLSIVGDASRHMAELIDDLLHLSRVTRAEMRRQPVNLSLLAKRIIVELRRLEPKRRVEIVIAPDLRVNADERLLRVALENLLNNAWKFTAKKRAARIEVGTETQEGGRVYYTRDNGAGFDMEYAGKLFGPFQRLHSTSEFPGHGIGLATVHRIITRHGGRIWAEGRPDEGATFYFTLGEE
jgi:PAS domain S-box-containing protein